jgi:hypothetical protein
MKNYTKKLYIIEKYFRGSKYNALVDQCLEHYNKHNYKSLDECLSKFPSEDKLLENLVEKLRGKSVYVGLKKVTEGKANDLDEIKSISSLITHVIIESKDNSEFKLLLPMLFEKLGVLIYTI